MRNDNKTRWEFIETWLPDYNTNEYVTLANDLAKYLAGEFDYQDRLDLKRINEIAQLYPTVDDVILEKERVECELFLSSLEEYRREQSQF